MNTWGSGDADRAQKLKQSLRGPKTLHGHSLEWLARHKKESDTSSGCRTSCSSYDVWDDDDGSDDGSISSSDSRPLSPFGTKMAAPMQLDKTVSDSRLHRKRMTGHDGDFETRRSAASGARRVVPIVVPVDLVPPSEFDLRSTNGLMKWVNTLAPLPTPEQLSGKHLAFHELQRIVDRWLRCTLDTLAPNHGPDSSAPATLLVGGSWHLKVGEAESDLDVVALMPPAITADVFFPSLCDHLRHERSVADLVARCKAAIPVLSFRLHRVCIDLLFARYAQTHAVPHHLPMLPRDDVHVMQDMDATSVRSLSVARVASLILELVPNASVFRSCLRVIRVWAKRRGVYSSKTGYLGGISWALLVCFVCQMFPRASVASLVHRFFSILATWQWPTPILVAHTELQGNRGSIVQWNPQHNMYDCAHVMPIITPGFPAVNTAVNVNFSTLNVLREEFARGKRIMDDLRRRSLSHPSSWTALFAPTEVLVRYDHHVAIELRAPSEATLAEWSSFVASRTRKLVETLQYTASVASLHPLPNLVRPRPESSEHHGVTGYYFIGYTVNAPQPCRNDCRHASSADHDALAQQSVTRATRYFLATELATASEKKPGMEIDISCCSWNTLPDAIFPRGRTAAIGDRAQYFLTHAHDVHLALGFAR